MSRTSAAAARRADPPRLRALTPLKVEAAAVRRGGPGCDVTVTGMGPQRSRTACRGLASARYEPTAVMGFGGALSPDVASGDLVVATEVRGAGAIVAMPSGQLVATALRRAGLTVHTGAIVSTDHVVSGDERARLAAGGALAVDMESAFLVEGLRGGRAVPPDGGATPASVEQMVIVRAMVDTPTRGLASPLALGAGVRAYRSLSRAAGVLATWAAATVPDGHTRTALLAGPRSFCAGVERAIEIVERALERFGAPVYVRRQIVHNVHVVRALEAKGARFVDELDEVPDGATVVFAAHGVAPTVRRHAERKELTVIDATCPLVAKVHTETRRFSAKGYRIVLIGHRGHEEVEGTIGEAPSAVQLVDHPEDVASVTAGDPSKVVWLTQTTLATDEVTRIVDRLETRFPTIRGPAAADICYATQNRQEAVRAVAAGCEVLLVVGSANSSNSNRLVEVAERQGCRAHLLDDASGLDLAWLAGVTTVGVTAGASAPEAKVAEVVAALGTLGPLQVEERAVTTESVTFSLPPELR